MDAHEPHVGPQANVPLAPLGTLGVGGAARWYYRATSIPAVQAAQRWAGDRNLPVFILGGGSNIVVGDGGFAGLVLHVAIPGAEERVAGEEVTVEAGAGELWDPFVERLVSAGYAGVECLSGIPGLVGGTPVQNVGAYGQEVAETIESVTVVDRQSNQPVVLGASDCGFSYRRSRFKGDTAGAFVICRVTFRLRRAAATVTYPDVIRWMDANHIHHAGVRDVRRAVLDIRRGKGMVLDASDVDTRSVGSFFTNPVVAARKPAEVGAPSFPMPGARAKIPAAWLIERAGFSRGFAAGAAGLSSKHPLAIVNRGGATASDILDLACRIKRAVLDRFGIALRAEPVFVGLDDDHRVRLLQEDLD